MKKEGERSICQECKANGINIEVVWKKITFKGEERLSLRNPDGSAHFNPIEDIDGKVTFEHTPTKSTLVDVELDEIRERLGKIERQLGIMWSGE